MSDDPKPGYDFFVPPPAAAPPAPAPAPAPQHGALNPDTFQATPGPFRLPRWANAGVAILAVILAGGLAAAIGVPMYQRHQLTTEFANTTIELPATFNGQTGASSGEAQQALERVATGFASTTARIYGSNPLNLVLIVVFRPSQAMSADDQATARAQLVREFNTGNPSPKLALTAAPDAGTLGGYLGCGKARASSTICLATDAGAMVAVVMGPGIQSPESVARQAREASVSRT